MSRPGGAPLVVALLATAAAGCGLDGRSVQGHGPLTGCEGQASPAIPADGRYYLTSFGGGSDSGTMSCGTDTDHGSWWYAASRQRYGCGARLRIEARGRCAVVQADDYGPDVCVERAAGGPVLDASPLVARALFDAGSAGWSDHFLVQVAEVDGATPLGPCAAPAPER
jgi:hypothetical protein